MKSVFLWVVAEIKMYIWVQFYQPEYFTYLASDDVEHDIFNHPMCPRDAYEAIYSLNTCSSWFPAIVGDIGIHTMYTGAG